MKRQDEHFKDEILNALAPRANVAQFVSFDPGLQQRFAWVRGHEPNAVFASVEAAVAALLEASPEGSVNIRSFEPHNPKSREFIYGQTEPARIVAELRRLAGKGLHTILNETVDVADGGVSGVFFGDVVEFAPKDTPRAVEKPGTAALPRAMAMKLFQTVYGFRPDVPDNPDLRVEFSLHPLRRGFHHQQTIIWEIESAGHPPEAPEILWPNRFSRFLGDKAYGLLIAWLSGLRVPRTTAIPRNLAPFSFGEPTGLAETWIRTCPTVQLPGLFTTQRGWLDPYRLMAEEDPQGDKIGALLAQQGVDAQFAGALIAQADGQPLIEGVSGSGDAFMVGMRGPETLPELVAADLKAVYRKAVEMLGPVRFEWAHDGERAWVVQLHRGATEASAGVIFPGEPSRFRRFLVTDGIEKLRAMAAEAKRAGEGVILVGRVGVTSHFGDILRKARIPSRVELPQDDS